ncbi:MAG: XRE family transcriptional regulator [Kiritimatiellae bacterium]|nr:XRE family transcriptional regulator [Kiritimatiellia bacterium]
MASAIRGSFASRVGMRIRTAREAKKLTQEQLCAQIGFKDRQTLTAIEAGQRKVSAEELTRFMSELGRDIDFFTDPFRLEGEGRFSFRAKGVAEGELEAFESTAGQWIAFWREQGRNQKVESSPLRFQLTLTEHSAFEEAQCAGESLAKLWNLGDVPATRLISTIEDKLSLLVLLVDMPAGISGAACQIAGADTILVNRKDSEGRRNFDLAHELFHVLTWDALPPERVDRESPPGHKAKRIEQLADNFASSILMPREILMPLWEARKETGLDVNEWHIAVAAQLHVTTWALGIRLKTLGLITDAEILKRDEEHLGGPVPAPFSRKFTERAGQALERADVSVMRLIKLLGTTGRGGLRELFKSQGLPEPVGV